MAVVAVWKCDRDGTMFDNKKEAEEHDKMLELAANITSLIEQHVSIDEQSSEAIGLLLAKHREKLAQACKGKPDVLLKLDDDAEPAKAEPKADKSEATDDGKVTSLAANQ